LLTINRQQFLVFKWQLIWRIIIRRRTNKHNLQLRRLNSSRQRRDKKLWRWSILWRWRDSAL
jgi:hypothetical protein